jgi:hypothetical protein
VNGVPVAVPVASESIVPSIVLFAPDRVIVGREARNLELSMPERTVRSVKRRMGGRGPDYEIDGRKLGPEEVSAEILRALKLGAEQSTGESIKDVVITVSAYFDDAQRRATLRAGELAGMNVLRLLNEPASASLVYDRVGAGGASAEQLRSRAWPPRTRRKCDALLGRTSPVPRRYSVVTPTQSPCTRPRPSSPSSWSARSLERRC